MSIAICIGLGCGTRPAKDTGAQTGVDNANAIAAEMAEPLHVRNCDFAQYHPLRMSSDWLWRGGIAKRVEPTYPPEAERKHLQGRISVRVLVNGYGRVEQACGDGNQILRVAAEDAALKWIFRPPRLNGEVIPYIQERLDFNFVLHEANGPARR